jgi:purine-binding chemotaxis protein CheW
MSSDSGGTASGGGAAPGSLLALADQLLGAQKGEEASVPVQIRQYVTFWLREEEFAIPILCCREILRPGGITRIPEAPPQVRGVINLRGKIVPVLDLRISLGLDPAVVTAKARLVVVEVAGRLFALLADRVARILKLASSQIGEPPEGGLPYVVGIAQAEGGAIRVLDTEQMVLGSPGVRSSTDKERPHG